MTVDGGQETGFLPESLFLQSDFSQKPGFSEWGNGRGAAAIARCGDRPDPG